MEVDETIDSSDPYAKIKLNNVNDEDI